MKKKLSLACLAALLFGLTLPVPAFQAGSQESVPAVARGDKKVYHPVNVHSVSKHPIIRL